jgi:hypothetical protein
MFYGNDKMKRGAMILIIMTVRIMPLSTIAVSSNGV